MESDVGRNVAYTTYKPIFLNLKLAIDGARCGQKPCVHNVKTCFWESHVSNPWSPMWAKTLRTQRKNQFFGILT